MQRQIVWPQQRPVLQKNLLTVRGLLHKNYQPFAELLAAEYQPPADWLNRDLLPSLILLPPVLPQSARAEVSAADSCNLALAMELSFLAGRVHDLLAMSDNVSAKTSAGNAGQTGLTAASRAILVGDYLYTAAAMKLARSGYGQWLARIGRTICRRSEAKLARLRWPALPYVPETEKLANLHKENAEAMALAAEIALSKLDWPENERQAWTEFGFYVGLAQGVLLTDGSRSACADAVRQAEQALKDLPEVQAAARTMILSKFDITGKSPRTMLHEQQEQIIL